MNNYNKKCEVCSIGYKTNKENQKTCSEKCRLTRTNEIKGILSDKGINAGTVGAMSEMAVAIDLMNKGYAVFRALSSACVCDLITIKDEKTLRIEVKTSYRGLSGNLIYPKPRHYKFDILAVYVRKDNKTYYMDNKRNPIEI